MSLTKGSPVLASDISGLNTKVNNLEAKLEEMNEISGIVYGEYGTTPVYGIPKFNVANHISYGPYDIGSQNYLKNFSDTDIYYKFMKTYQNQSWTTTGNYWNNPGNEADIGWETTIPEQWLQGQFSYAFTRTAVYELNHKTRTATKKSDFTSYCVGSSDGIFAVDGDYVYLAKHAGSYYGTLYKFTHAGSLITSKDYTDTSAWRVDVRAGFSGSSSYVSIFSSSFRAYLCSTVQTKNFIILTTKSSATSTSGNKIYYNTYISKNSLSIIGKGVSKSLSASDLKAIPFFNDDVIFYTYGDGSYFYVEKITESGVTLNSSNYSSSRYIKINSNNYYIDYIKPLVINHDGDDDWLIFTLDYNSTNYYGIMKISDIVPFNETLSVTDMTSYFSKIKLVSSNPGYSVYNYDPIKKDWNDGLGNIIPDLRDYTPPPKVGVMQEKYAGNTPYVSFFKTDDVYYFVRDDKNVYTLDAKKPIYYIERIETKE